MRKFKIFLVILVIFGVFFCLGGGLDLVKENILSEREDDQIAEDCIILGDGAMWGTQINNTIYGITVMNDGTVYVSKTKLSVGKRTVYEATFDEPAENDAYRYSSQYWNNILEYAKSTDLSWYEVGK